MTHPGERVQADVKVVTRKCIADKEMKLYQYTSTLERLGVKHKLIRPYTPRHNGKVERSHRKDHNKFYSCHSFYYCAYLNAKLAARSGRTNNLSMRPSGWLSPIKFFKNFVQYH